MKTKDTSNNGRVYGGVSPEQRKAQRNKQFLDAGLTLFGSKGFRATTVRSLCKQARLTDRYFYECCGSIERLLVSVYEHCMTDLTRKILATVNETYPVYGASEAMRAALDTYFRELEDPRIARVCMVELEGISPEVNRLYTNYIRGFARILEEMSRHAFPSWKIDPEERRILSISIIGALRQSATNWLMTDYAAPREKLVSGTHRLFSAMIDAIDLVAKPLDYSKQP